MALKLNCVTVNPVDPARAPGGSAPGGSSAMARPSSSHRAGKAPVLPQASDEDVPGDDSEDSPAPRFADQFIFTQHMDDAPPYTQTQGESSQMNMTQTQREFSQDSDGDAQPRRRRRPVPIAYRPGYVGSVGQQMSSAHKIRGRHGRLAQPKTTAAPGGQAQQACRWRGSPATPDRLARQAQTPDTLIFVVVVPREPQRGGTTKVARTPQWQSGGSFLCLRAAVILSSTVIGGGFAASLWTEEKEEREEEELAAAIQNGLAAPGGVVRHTRAAAGPLAASLAPAASVAALASACGAAGRFGRAQPR
ncbi:hypothetical protein HU200_021583 [Digitaria exilis]|uniref:Uncharacterized protein n=1 Tax=Digitaria exilis TaxID=1010633 RepID=A0A835EZB2_9POAL|nr:hypothetical protein HU200_021583 [Digitaria exilis]